MRVRAAPAQEDGMARVYVDLNKQLTSDEASLKEQVHRFAAEVLRPTAMELDKMSPQDVIAPGSPLWDVFKHIYSLGYHIRALPEEMGGVELTPLAQHIYSEEMGWGACDLAISLGVTAMPFFFASRSGNQDLMREFVVPFSQDREGKLIGCWAVTEPPHGSDAVFMGDGLKETPEGVAFELQARLDGDDWVIRGQKSYWVSNGTIATQSMVHMGQ